MPLKTGVLDRLLLSKSFLDRIRFQPVAVHERQTLAATLVAAHDAAELAIAAIASQLDSLPKNKGNSYLMDYFDPIEKATGVTVHAKDYFSQLNRVRNNLKHEGLYPDSRQWSRVGEFVFQHIMKWCQDLLGIPFGDLDESASLQDEDAKRLYDGAKQSAAQGHFKLALERIAVALSVVYGENAALRGLAVGVPRSDDAIRLSGFGVHANDFLALATSCPVLRFMARMPEYQYGSSQNLGTQAIGRGRRSISVCERLWTLRRRYREHGGYRVRFPGRLFMTNKLRLCKTT